MQAECIVILKPDFSTVSCSCAKGRGRGGEVAGVEDRGNARLSQLWQGGDSEGGGWEAGGWQWVRVGVLR
jgi:hypothetical protein